MEYEQIKLQQDALEKLRKATIHGNAAQKIAKRDFEKAQAELHKWTKRYELALQNNNKQLASQAKFQKERYQAIAHRLRDVVREQEPQLYTMKAKLDDFEEKLSPQSYDNIENFNFITSEKINDELTRIKNEMFLIENYNFESIYNGISRLENKLQIFDAYIELLFHKKN